MMLPWILTFSVFGTVFSSKLLVVSPPSFRQEHSKFFRSLDERGYQLTFRTEKEGPPLYDEGITDWKAVILVGTPSKSYSQDITPQSLYKYLTAPTPGNLFLIVPPSASDFLRDFSREFSADFSYSQNYALSHYPPSDDPLTLSLGPSNVDPSFFNLTQGKPLLYKGAAHELTDIPLAKARVWGPKEGYVWDPEVSGGVEEGEEILTGTNVKLVSTFQTRGGGRVVLSGSTDLLADKFWTEETSNEDFLRELTKWGFGEKGALRVKNSWHYKVGKEDEVDPSIYRIKDIITYNLEVEELTPQGWVPFQPIDAQLEFRMLDPHLRIPLVSSPNSTYISATFMVPDRHGVFTFLVDWRRDGYTSVYDNKKVSVTPLRHNEYPRWIKGAFPWYAGAVSTTVAFLAFSAVWLGTEDVEGKKKVE